MTKLLMKLALTESMNLGGLEQSRMHSSMARLLTTAAFFKNRKKKLQRKLVPMDTIFCLLMSAEKGGTKIMPF